MTSRTRGQPRQQWQQIVLSYWCPDCDSGPGKWCITRHGSEKTEPHSARVNVVGRCTRCRAWLHAEYPELMCPRCDVLYRRDVPDDG